jgi:hypothetical protein
MCVDVARSRLFGRAEFLATIAAAASPVFAAATLAEPANAAVLEALSVPAGLRPGNERAARIAAGSPFVARTYRAALELAHSIGDASLREGVVALLRDPKPLYASRHPSPESREAVRQALVRENLIVADAPLSAIFPPGTEADAAHAPQPFWAAAGSDANSHHSYPGGLAAHEHFNATIAAQFATTYDRVYFDDRNAVDRDTVVAAALYHDIMKTVVFQWNDDGSLFLETPIGATGGHDALSGGHHALSGAEAIARGRSPGFVVTLLSAHAAPSLGDEGQVATWCRAAAIIAGVDPVEYGLLRKDGGQFALAPEYVPLEAFVNYLSDHDFVLTIHAVREVLPELRRLSVPHVTSGAAADSRRYPTFAWFKNDVLANCSAVGLYQKLARGGRPAFDRAVNDFLSSGRSTVATLTP